MTRLVRCKEGMLRTNNGNRKRPVSWLKRIKSKWDTNHRTEQSWAWIKRTANSLIKKTNGWDQKSKSTLQSAYLCKNGGGGGTKVRIKCTWVKKLVKKMVKWKDLCSGMPKRDSCSRNQLFHLEIVSLPRSLFATSFDFFFFSKSLLYIQVWQYGDIIHRGRLWYTNQTSQYSVTQVSAPTGGRLSSK